VAACREKLIRLATFLILCTCQLYGEMGKVPPGFQPIFNGKNLMGWHVSKTNHHGTTPDLHVTGGILTGAQNPPGKGGIPLTDKKYKNVESISGSNPTGAATAACSHARPSAARLIRC
jgi:hypothetical protein